MRPTAYRVVIEDELAPPMRLETNDGNTDLVGPVEDQAALQGLLDNIAALGLALVSVTPIDHLT